VPPRYDVGARTHINEDIRRYNMNLRKAIKGLHHVSLITITHNRDMFTRHGLHLNASGKELLSKTILRIQAVKRKNLSPLQTDPSLNTSPASDQVIAKPATDDLSMTHADLASKDMTPDQIRTEEKSHVKDAEPDAEHHESLSQDCNQNKQDSDKETPEIPTQTTSGPCVSCRTSSRQKRPPTTKNNDFLW
jgi:hypothetical protein